MPATRNRRPKVRPVRAILLVLTLAACGGGADPETAIDRETFVETYLDLRAPVLVGTRERITPAEREAVLARHGVTEEQLLEFAEVHGADPGYMDDVWTEIESRLDELRSGEVRAPGDSVG